VDLSGAPSYQVLLLQARARLLQGETEGRSARGLEEVFEGEAVDGLGGREGGREEEGERGVRKE